MSEKVTERIYATANVKCNAVTYAKARPGDMQLQEIKIEFKEPVPLKAKHTYYLVLDIDTDEFIELKDVTGWSYTKREKWLENLKGVEDVELRDIEDIEKEYIDGGEDE